MIICGWNRKIIKQVPIYNLDYLSKIRFLPYFVNTYTSFGSLCFHLVKKPALPIYIERERPGARQKRENKANEEGG